MQFVIDFALLLMMFVILVFFLTGILVTSIKVLKEYERAVIFRLGKALPDIKGPGVIFLIPIMDKMNKVDLREAYFEIPHQRCITEDNAPVDIDLIIYYRVVSAKESILKVQDFRGAALGVSQTILRSVVGDIVLDDVLAKREYINNILRQKLDEITERWGVKVTNVEIREILPPQDVQEAMIKQMRAERERRAMVTQADGQREATITVAEGDKKSAILKAEGDQQAMILRAEGNRQAALLQATGLAGALDKMFAVAKNVDGKTMTLQYLDALKKIGESPATKYIFPMEFLKLIEPIQKLVPKFTELEEEKSK